jgi:hypothetical protein
MTAVHEQQIERRVSASSGLDRARGAQRPSNPFVECIAAGPR